MVEGYLFAPIGRRGAAVLVAGSTLGEQDVFSGWQFDPARRERRMPQQDIVLRDRETIRRRAVRQGPHHRFELEVQYVRTGQIPSWPE